MNKQKQSQAQTTTLFANIRKAADALHDSGLPEEVLDLESLNAIREQLKLDDTKEAAVISIIASRATRRWWISTTSHGTSHALNSMP